RSKEVSRNRTTVCELVSHGDEVGPELAELLLDLRVGALVQRNLILDRSAKDLVKRCLVSLH
ncbi:MAG: hypothetical protein ACYCU8_16045, partial [Ferrimicrobium acidiphilum]